MKRCVILAGSPETEIAFLRRTVSPEDYLICADAGCRYACAAGLIPSLLIGDFDSSQPSKEVCAEILTYSPEKDETDTMLALMKGLEYGFQEFLILGGTGARLDHTIANIHLLVYAMEHGAHAVLADSRNRVQVLRNESVRISREETTYLSLFAWGGDARDVTVQGVQYPLDSFFLRANDPLGVSNRIIQPYAEISVSQGTLLILLSRDV